MNEAVPAGADYGAEARPCSLCGRPVAAGPVATINGHLACADCSTQVERELAAQSPSAKAFVPAAIAGLVGSLIGATVWAVIGIAASVQVGYVAVLVGFLAGLGVKLGAGKARGPALQWIAAALALFGLLAARYIMFAHFAIAGVASKGIEVSYLDHRLPGLFFGALGQMMSPFDLLWIFLAVSAAWRVPKAKPIQLSRT